MTTTPAPRLIGRLLSRLRIRRTLRKASAATHSQSDRIAYSHDRWLIRHPEACSTDATYPGWAEHCAALEAANHRTPEETS